MEGGTIADCITASSFTITGVPTGALLKNVSAISRGTRIQPCDAAYGGTYPWCIAYPPRKNIAKGMRAPS